MPRFLKFVVDSDSYTSWSTASVRPAKRPSPSAMKENFSSADSPGTRLVVAIAPALTIGLMVRSG